MEHGSKHPEYRQNIRLVATISPGPPDLERQRPREELKSKKRKNGSNDEPQPSKQIKMGSLCDVLTTLDARRETTEGIGTVLKDKENPKSLETYDEADELESDPEEMGGMIDEYVEEADGRIDLLNIDAYWLVRKIYQAHKGQRDIRECKEIAGRVLKDLYEAKDKQGLNYLPENQGHLVELIWKNRLCIVLCTRLARAVDKTTRKKIEEELMPKIENEFKMPKRYIFPEGSYKIIAGGCEEIHLPDRKPPPYETCMKIADMPKWARPAFEGMEKLNRLQSEVYENAFSKQDNMLLSAPTGAGKAGVALLSILNCISLHMDDDGSFNKEDYLILYVIPMKALVAQVVGDLTKRLRGFGLSVKGISGDQSFTRQRIEGSQVIVSTLNCVDCITQISGCRLKLIVIDQIHLLEDHMLESIVAKTLRLVETTKEHTRLVGLSETLPSYEQSALFLRVYGKTSVYHFDSCYRGVPLKQLYIGTSVKTLQERSLLMNHICYKTIVARERQSVLIFVQSDKETTQTAVDILNLTHENGALGSFMKEGSRTFDEETPLKDLMPAGFAIHHAGMTRSDRQLALKSFAEDKVQVLISTTTLAWSGLKPSAQMVIVKGTQFYNSRMGACVELSQMDVRLMLNCARRPNSDSHCEGIVLSDKARLHTYISWMNQKLPIESQFMSNLADRLDSEPALGTVQNAPQVLDYTSLSLDMGRTLNVLAQDITTPEGPDRVGCVHYGVKHRFCLDKSMKGTFQGKKVCCLSFQTSNDDIDEELFAGYEVGLKYPHPNLLRIDLVDRALGLCLASDSDTSLNEYVDKISPYKEFVIKTKDPMRQKKDFYLTDVYKKIFRDILHLIKHFHDRNISVGVFDESNIVIVDGSAALYNLRFKEGVTEKEKSLDYIHLSRFMDTFLLKQSYLSDCIGGSFHTYTDLLRQSHSSNWVGGFSTFEHLIHHNIALMTARELESMYTRVQKFVEKKSKGLGPATTDSLSPNICGHPGWGTEVIEMVGSFLPQAFYYNHKKPYDHDGENSNEELLRFIRNVVVHGDEYEESKNMTTEEVIRTLDVMFPGYMLHIQVRLAQSGHLP